MKNLLIKECSLKDIEEIKYICEKTFYDTFSHENTKEDMDRIIGIIRSILDR